MDKSWITKPRNSLEYAEGVRRFINFAFEHCSVNGRTICPCSKCHFKRYQTRDAMFDHLICKQFPQGYTFWFYHGETTCEPSNGLGPKVSNVVQKDMINEYPIQNMINDTSGVDRFRAKKVPFTSNENIGEAEGEEVASNIIQKSNEAEESCTLVRDGEQPLYEGCTKYSKLSFLMKLYHIKCLCGMSDMAMSMILELLQDAFQQAKIPSSVHEIKETITKLGLDCDKIQACPNNCILYWGNNKNEDKRTCKVCNHVCKKSRRK